MPQLNHKAQAIHVEESSTETETAKFPHTQSSVNAPMQKSAYLNIIQLPCCMRPRSSVLLLTVDSSQIDASGHLQAKHKDESQSLSFAFSIRHRELNCL